jgi:hypothetical protein
MTTIPSKPNRLPDCEPGRRWHFQEEISVMRAKSYTTPRRGAQADKRLDPHVVGKAALRALGRPTTDDGVFRSLAALIGDKSLLVSLPRYLDPRRIENDLWVLRDYFPQIITSRDAFPEGTRWQASWPALRQQLGGAIFCTHPHPLDAPRQHSISHWEWQWLTDLRAMQLPVLWYPGYRATAAFSVALLDELQLHRFGVLRPGVASRPFEPAINLFGMVRPIEPAADNVVTLDGRRG